MAVEKQSEKKGKKKIKHSVKKLQGVKKKDKNPFKQDPVP